MLPAPSFAAGAPSAGAALVPDAARVHDLHRPVELSRRASSHFAQAVAACCLLAPEAAQACSECRPQVLAAVFDRAFLPTALALLSPLAMLALIARLLPWKRWGAA